MQALGEVHYVLPIVWIKQTGRIDDGDDDSFPWARASGPARRLVISQDRGVFGLWPFLLYRPRDRIGLDFKYTLEIKMCIRRV